MLLGIPISFAKCKYLDSSFLKLVQTANQLSPIRLIKNVFTFSIDRVLICTFRLPLAKEKWSVKRNHSVMSTCVMCSYMYAWLLLSEAILWFNCDTGVLVSYFKEHQNITKFLFNENYINTEIVSAQVNLHWNITISLTECYTHTHNHSGFNTS